MVLRRGDKVIFRLGEREVHECLECGWVSANSEHEAYLVEATGQTLEVLQVYDSFKVNCPRCGDLIEAPRAALLYYLLCSNPEQGWDGFWAFDSEVYPLDKPVIAEGRFR